MKILIVGSSSVIGRYFTNYFSGKAHVLTAGRKQANFIIDLTRWDFLPEINDEFDAVIQVAADFGGKSDQDIIRAELVNAVGTLCSCRIAHEAKAKHYILLSSLSATYKHGDPYYSIYSLSKRHSEDAAQFFCHERGIPLTILRPSQVYDARGECRKHQALLYMMADHASLGQSIYVYGTHDARRNYLYIDDLAEVCWRIVQNSYIGTFTCAHPQSVRLSEMACAAFAASNKGGQLFFLPSKPNLVDLPSIEDYTIYQRINYWPSIDINAGFGLINQHKRGL